MDRPIRTLHHVTATVDGAQEDLDFCAGTLALRLVKKTVNFDNHNVFHFYYGDERGTPGTIWTTFPYRGWRVPRGVKGTGQVTVTSFSVPTGSLAFWKERLATRGVTARDVVTAFGEEGLSMRDPSGLDFELIATPQDSRSGWSAGGVTADHAIRGLHRVTIVVPDLAPTVALLTGLLGFHVVDEADQRTRVALGDGGAGATIDVMRDDNAPAASNGMGTVHHVALAIDGASEQLLLRRELVGLGIPVTEVLDRSYFTSIYFREPGGVLLEVATTAPGFTTDEELSRLGEELKLPSWEEPNRATIEAGLPAIVVR